MKRIFCDCCGEEMTYDDAGIRSTLPNGSGQAIQFMGVEVVVKLIVEPTKANGAHTDVCGKCRWAVIDKVDPRPRADDSLDPFPVLDDVITEHDKEVFGVHGAKLNMTGGQAATILQAKGRIFTDSTKPKK